MAETSNVRCALAFVVGYFECLLFGTIISGWPSLVYLIKEDRIYGSLCQNNSQSINYNTDGFFNEAGISSKVCLAEENIYNLIFGIGITMQHCSSLSSAFLLEYLGLKKTRVLNSLMFFTSGTILGFTTNGRPYFLFIGIILMAVATGQQRLINFQVANFFPNSKTTVLSLYVGANIGASGVFLLFQYASDYASIHWNTSFFIYGGLSLLMLMPTIFLLPESLVQKTKTRILNNGSNNKALDETSPLLKEAENNGLSTNPNCQPIINTPVPFLHSAVSFTYISYLGALFITALLAVSYNGMFNWWVDQIISDVDIVKWLTEMFGNLQLISIVLQPLIGFTVDTCLRKAKNEKDLTKRVRNERWISFIILSTLISLSIATLAMTFNSTIAAVETSVVFFALARCMISFSHPIYIRLSFPSAHFNKLFGIAGLIVAVAAQVQHLVFLWIQDDYTTPRWTIIALLVLSYISPLHLLCLKKNVVVAE